VSCIDCRNELYHFSFRSSYTQRILEIISNIEKQKKEINKNLNDTRLVQKEINSLDGKVERCFISIDELMFKVFLFTSVSIVPELYLFTKHFHAGCKKRRNNTKML